jgi:ABC-type bacteriocin/lantibiotic exporter with double-glycine peptidase domain
MVLSGFGLEVSEAELRAMCDCTPLGTDALKAVDAARQLGLIKTAKHTLSADELQTLVANGKYPIVFVDVYPIEGLHSPHALVVVDLRDAYVLVYDPAAGERFLPRRIFDVAWSLRHNLAIIVEP